MFFSNLFSTRKTSAGNVQPKRTQLVVESLESRTLLSAVVFNEPVDRDIKTVNLAAGDSHRVMGSYRSDPDTTVPWYQDIDDYVIPVTPGTTIALKATTPDGTIVGPAYANMTYKGNAADGTLFYFTEKTNSITIRASSINRLGNYSFELTKVSGYAGPPDLQVSNLRVTSHTATFDYKIVDPIPNRVQKVPSYADLIGVKANGSSTLLKTVSFSTDPTSAWYSPNSVNINLAGLNLTPYAKLRIKATPSGWTESNGGNNTAEITLGAKPADIRINSAKMENATLTVNATLTGNITHFLIGLYTLPEGVTSPNDARAVRQWNINATHNGQEGTFNFAVPIGTNGVRLPGAGADGRADNYSFFAVVDPEGKLAETNELNNAAPMTGWYQNGSNLFVQGGPEADIVRIAADDANKQVLLTLNGRTSAIQNGMEKTYFVRGHGGNDRLDVNFGKGGQRMIVSAFGGSGRNAVTIVGSAGNDTASLYANPKQRSKFIGPNYGIFFSDFADATATGNGGNDSVSLFDSVGKDTLTYKPAETRMVDSGSTYSIKAVGFNIVQAYSRTGDSDRAELYGSNYYQNNLVGAQDQTTLAFDKRTVAANWFANIDVYGNAAGTDTAKLTDTFGSTQLTVRNGAVEMLGYQVNHKVSGFRTVEAVAGKYITTANVYCTGTDNFTAHTDRALVTGANFKHTLQGFKNVTAYAAKGNKATANFYGTSSASFFADPASAQMTLVNAYDNRALGFANVLAYGVGSAHLTGSGGRDLLKASNVYANLTGTFGGTNFSLYVKNFSNVWVDGKGNAQAMLYDTLGNDTLTVGGTTAILRDEGKTFAIVVKKFSHVRAVSQQGGIDRLVDSEDRNFQLEAAGPWQR